MPGVILDIEQQMLLLEIEPPFDKRDVQIARRRMAKRWHPDIAPAGKQFEHERHLKAINEAADHLTRLAETSRGGKVSRGAVKVSAAAARQAREEAGRRAYEAEQRAREQAADRERNDPFGSRVPDHSVVHRYARCQSYPEWGVGTVEGIYFTGDYAGYEQGGSSADEERRGGSAGEGGGSSADEEGSLPGSGGQQWARVKFSHGVRTVPAGSMKFVDFSKPDPAEDRVERFMTAAQRAMAEGEYELAAQRLVYARDAEPRNVGVLRLMTLAFWQAGNLEAAARSVRDWARVDGERPAPHRFAARIYEDMGAIDLAEEAAERAAERGPSDAGAWERLGRLRLRLVDREGAVQAFERALGLGAGAKVRDLLAQALALEPRMRQMA
jgi:curved DNA-binding protein CbpA